MPIQIRPHVAKDGKVTWHAYVKKGDSWDYVKSAGLIAIGLSPDLDYAQAKERADTLNAQEKIRRVSEKRLAIANRLETEREEQLAFLPRVDIEEFERRILAPKFMASSEVDPKHKIMVKWRASLRTMRAVKLDPSDWADEAFLFYNYFLKQRFSPGYVERIISLLNHYGYFYCKKYKKAFLPLPKQRGQIKIRQVNAYRNKPNRKHKAAPITPGELEAQKGNLSLENYNWLYLSIWLGLRPEEIDALHDTKSEHSYYFSEKDGVRVLHVYQTKLVEAVDEEDRWKLIPLICPEQKTVPRLIASGKFKRPLVKTLQKYFSDKAGTYSGRKGFTDLMLAQGQLFEHISQWLGHSSLDRTWSDYKDRKTVHFIKPKKAA